MTSHFISNGVDPSIAREAKPRAGRFERNHQAANIALDANPHYFQVMAWLLKLRFMTTEQIGRVIDPSRTRSSVYDLLRRMYDAELITRFDVPFRRKWGEGSTYGSAVAIHCLDSEGAKFLADRYETERSQIDWLPRDNQKNTSLDHRLEANNVIITMYLAAKRLDWRFDIVQSEREIHKRGGHDRVIDSKTGDKRPVKADAVCRLTLPTDKSAWISLELDMGTEGPKKIKRKFRLHRQHYISGKYEKRHSTRRSRILFVVADIRDPWLIKPMTEKDWRRRIEERVLMLKRWAKEAGMEHHFWFTSAIDLTEETVWHKPIWLRVATVGKVSFL